MLFFQAHFRPDLSRVFRIVLSCPRGMARHSFCIISGQCFPSPCGNGCS